jgi:hypothetical protein
VQSAKICVDTEERKGTPQDSAEELELAELIPEPGKWRVGGI